MYTFVHIPQSTHTYSWHNNHPLHYIQDAVATSCLCELGTHSHSHAHPWDTVNWWTQPGEMWWGSGNKGLVDFKVETRQTDCRPGQKAIWTEVVSGQRSVLFLQRFSLCGRFISCHACRWLSGRSHGPECKDIFLHRVCSRCVKPCGSSFEISVTVFLPPDCDPFDKRFQHNCLHEGYKYIYLYMFYFPETSQICQRCNRRRRFQINNGKSFF